MGKPHDDGGRHWTDTATRQGWLEPQKVEKAGKEPRDFSGNVELLTSWFQTSSLLNVVFSH